MSALRYAVLGLECKVLLGEVAERHDYNSGKHLRNGRIQMKMFYEKLDENVIQEHTEHHQDKIPEKLYPASQYRTRKNNVPVQKVTGRKRNGKRDQEGGYMWADWTGRGKYNLFLKDKIV